MIRKMFQCAAAGAVFAACGLFSANAHAAWGSGGSYGSTGSYGSSAGVSYGSWGSSGGYSAGSSGGAVVVSGSSGGASSGGASSGGSSGQRTGFLARLRERREARRAAKASSGGSASSGGASSGGSSGSWGSSGGSGGGVYVSPMPEAAVPPTPPPDQGTAIPRDGALLTVNLPADAKVFVNGSATRSTGGHREYVSRNLDASHAYTYEVRAEVVRDGKKLVQTKVVDLSRGGRSDLRFDFDKPETTLSVTVPENARVFLAGNEMQTPGKRRVFTTTGLGPGEVWEDYKITVKIDRDGRTLTEEKSIRLGSGEWRAMEFRFDEAKIASTR